MYRLPLLRYWLKCVRVVIRMLYGSWKRTVSILPRYHSESASSVTFGLCHWCNALWRQTCWWWTTRPRALLLQRAQPTAAASIQKPQKSGFYGGSACCVNNTGGWMSRSSCPCPSRKVRCHPWSYCLLVMVHVFAAQADFYKRLKVTDFVMLLLTSV